MFNKKKKIALQKQTNKGSVNAVYDKCLYLLSNPEAKKVIDKYYPELAIELRTVRDRHLKLIDEIPKVIKMKIK